MNRLGCAAYKLSFLCPHSSLKKINIKLIQKAYKSCPLLHRKCYYTTQSPAGCQAFLCILEYFSVLFELLLPVALWAVIPTLTFK